MSSTNCHRCKRLMASALPVCPHCGAAQDASSRAESTRRDRITWLAIGIGAVLGTAVGGLAWGSTESLIAGPVVGALVGRVIVVLRYRW